MTYPPYPPYDPNQPASGPPGYQQSPPPAYPPVTQPVPYGQYPPPGYPPPQATFQATVQRKLGFTGAHAAVWVAVIVVAGLLAIPVMVFMCCCGGPAMMGLVDSTPTPTP